MTKLLKNGTFSVPYGTGVKIRYCTVKYGTVGRPVVQGDTHLRPQSDRIPGYFPNPAVAAKKNDLLTNQNSDNHKITNYITF